MGLFNRKKVNISTNNNTGDFNFLSESAYSDMMSSIKGVPLYNFISALRNVNDSEFFFGYTYDRMMDDAIISSAIDLYVDDATQIDPNKQRMVWAELDLPDNYKEEELSKGLITEINNFLDEIKIQKNLPQIARMIMVHGDAPIKLSFVDKLEDDRLQVHKLNENIDIKGLTDTFNTNNIISDSESKIDLSNKPKLLEDCINSLKSKDRILNKYNKKYLKESIMLKEADSLITYKDVMQGRWYIETLGNGTNLFALESKGKLIALIDKDNNSLIDKDNIALFINPKATRVTFEVGGQMESINKKEYYVVSKGDSFLKNARIAWQVLAALEDILLLTSNSLTEK